MIKHGTWALLLAACLVVGASPAADGVQTADPAWGDYAALAGRTARAGTEGYQLRWYWAEPGKELVQEYRNPGDSSVAHREVITLGASPGTLMLQSSAMGKKRWNGTVQPDGSVLFIGKGLLKLPYLAGEGGDGTWQVRGVELDDGRIASVDEVTKYNRFAFEEPGATAAQTDAAVTPQAVSADGAALPVATGSPAPAVSATAAVAASTAATVSAAAPAATPEPTMFGALKNAVGLGEQEPEGPQPAIAADFGVMSEFVGRQFVYRDVLGSVALADGGQTLVLQFGSHVYHLRATERPDRYEVTFNSQGLSPKAKRFPNGSIEVSFSTRSVDDMIGTRHRIRFDKGDQGGIDLFAEYHSIAAILAGWEFSWSANYRPYSDTAAAEERRYAQWDREDNAERARQRAIEQAESDAAWGRALSNMSNNLSDYAAREQQNMDESQAMLDEINAMARAEAEAQRYAEQQAAQQYAAQQQMARQQQAAQQQQALAQQQAAMRDRQSQLQAQPVRSTGGTGSWETAGQSSGGGSPTPAGRASTHSDPSGCVTPPVLGPNRACGKGTSASITNQCPQVVDARMCLMTPRGWDCGARYGLQPGDSWSWASCSGTDEVFHDVRSSDSDEPLANP